MTHSITLTIPFSFKGINLKPSAVIDLEHFCQQGLERGWLCHIVATENNIDRYSYEYEILETSVFHFSAATGLAKQHLSGHSFDLDDFKQALKEIHVINTLQQIARETLDIDNLDAEQHKKLKQALLQAYYAKRADQQ
jgi:hypothetical protein